MKALLPYIIDSIDRSGSRHEVHSFASGAIMIDIWIAAKFYVIQIYGDTIGLSEVTEEDPGFSTIPQHSYNNAGDFKIEFEKIFL